MDSDDDKDYLSDPQAKASVRPVSKKGAVAIGPAKRMKADKEDLVTSLASLKEATSKKLPSTLPRAHPSKRPKHSVKSAAKQGSGKQPEEASSRSKFPMGSTRPPPPAAPLVAPPIDPLVAPPKLPPTSLPSLVGHAQALPKIHEWFDAKQRSLPTKFNALFLEGPLGNGKSLIIKTMCQAYGFEIFGLTPSKIGGWPDLCYFMDRFAYATSIRGKPLCVLVDHVDVLVSMGTSITKLAGTRGKAKKSSGSSVGDLVKMLKALAPTSNPIVFSATSQDSRAVRDLTAACLTVKTYALAKGDGLTVARKWLRTHKVSMEPTVYTRLMDESFGDMRRLQNELLWASTSGPTGRKASGAADILTTAAARSLFSMTQHIFRATGNPAKNIARSNALFSLDDRLGSMIHHNYLRSLGAKDTRKAKCLSRLLLKGQSLANQAWAMAGYGFSHVGHALEGWALASVRSKPLSEVQYTKIPALGSTMRSRRAKLHELQTMMDLRVADTEEFWMTIHLVQNLANEDGLAWPEEWSHKTIQDFSLP